VADADMAAAPDVLALDHYLLRTSNQMITPVPIIGHRQGGDFP
jgi:hypothetical protein